MLEKIVEFYNEFKEGVSEIKVGISQIKLGYNTTSEIAERLLDERFRRECPTLTTILLYDYHLQKIEIEDMIRDKTVTPSYFGVVIYLRFNQEKDKAIEGIYDEIRINKFGIDAEFSVLE